MKTRYLTVFLTAAGAMFALSACDGGSSTLDPNVEARLRNDLPAVCTAEQIRACPAVEVTRCPGGQEPVIDYSSDCCAHFTCQPLCSSANQRTCPMTPAPACPARTKLWIGTAIEDCCPAYRCEPDGTDLRRDQRRLHAGAAVLRAEHRSDRRRAERRLLPDLPVPVPDGRRRPSRATARRRRRTWACCGCTYPNCQAGEELACEGTDACRGPCYCKPARGICKDDSSCAADQKCDLSACRLPPMTTTEPARAACEVTKCGPQLGLPTIMCADGSAGGNTGRCLLNADGTCGWEVRDVPAGTGLLRHLRPRRPADRVPGEHRLPDRPGVQRRVQGVGVRSRRNRHGYARHRSGDRHDRAARARPAPAISPTTAASATPAAAARAGRASASAVRAAAADLRSEQADRLPDVRDRSARTA